MDGPWQVGHKTADEYGRLANEVAKTLRAFDRSLELIVCGSSNADMKTYPEWERIVLEHTYDAVDHISLHMYFANRSKNAAEYLALNAKLDAYIDAIASTIEFVRANKRSRKRVTISFDEWNVWYHSNAQDREILGGAKGWPHAPRLLEDIYNFEDALQVGCILNTFIRRSDVVKIACIAQLVNVIAPIMTEPGGAAWRQTIFYPYFFASVYGRGEALQLSVKSPGYDSQVADNVPYLDISGVHDEAGAHADVLRGQPACRARRSTSSSTCKDLASARIADHQVMTQRRPRSREHLKRPPRRCAKEGVGRGGQGRTPDRETAALFLSDAAPRPRVGIDLASNQLRSAKTGAPLIRAVHRRSRRRNLVDHQTNIAVVLHESVEVDLPQDQESTIGHGDDVGLPRHSGEQRHLAEQVTAAERDASTWKNDFGGAGSDEIAGVALFTLPHDQFARRDEPGPSNCCTR